MEVHPTIAEVRAIAEVCDALGPPENPVTVYGVHSVQAEEISLTVLVASNQSLAERYAAMLSTHPGVLAAGVTEFVVDTLGRRSAVAMYVTGTRQIVPYVSDDRRIFVSAHGADHRAKRP
jgi:hypothetical protein